LLMKDVLTVERVDHILDAF